MMSLGCQISCCVFMVLPERLEAMAVAYYIHAKGDGIHCELSPPKGK